VLVHDLRQRERRQIVGGCRLRAFDLGDQPGEGVVRIDNDDGDAEQSDKQEQPTQHVLPPGEVQGTILAALPRAAADSRRSSCQSTAGSFSWAPPPSPRRRVPYFPWRRPRVRASSLRRFVPIFRSPPRKRTSIR